MNESLKNTYNTIMEVPAASAPPFLPGKGSILLEAVRTLIYTTNAIEGFNRQLRKVTKNKSVFPTDDSLLKMLYLAMIDITKKWTGKRKDWGQIHSQLEIFFADRLPQ